MIRAIVARLFCWITIHRWIVSPIPPHSLMICRRCPGVWYRLDRGEWRKIV